MTTPKVEVYFPHRHRPFVIDGADGPLFSNENHDLCVITGSGFEWSEYREMLLRGLVEPGSRGFVGLSAWVPGAGSLNAAMERLIGPLNDCGAFTLGSFASSIEKFNAVFDLRDQYGRWASGEWCIGACQGDGALVHSPQLIGPLGGFPDGFALANAASIRWSICLSEQQESLMTIKLTPHTERLIADLVGRLEASLP